MHNFMITFSFLLSQTEVHMHTDFFALFGLNNVYCFTDNLSVICTQTTGL
jgi:hypothetical protein